MKRRALLIGTVSGVALAAGAASAVWRWRAGEHRADAGPDLWRLSFATPAGPPLEMSSLRGKPLLLNFWATWCPPCVTEMPLLDAFARAPQSCKVLALAIDSAENVVRFIDERRLRLPVALAGDDGLELAVRLGNRAGGLPFSVLFDAAGAAVQRRLGPLDAGLLSSWSASVQTAPP
ncbi:MAG: TlpA disulfide reductase family protein [Caldimonas sp.]